MDNEFKMIITTVSVVFISLLLGMTIDNYFDLLQTKAKCECVETCVKTIIGGIYK